MNFLSSAKVQVILESEILVLSQPIMYSLTRGQSEGLHIHNENVQVV